MIAFLIFVIVHVNGSIKVPFLVLVHKIKKKKNPDMKIFKFYLLYRQFQMKLRSVFQELLAFVRPSRHVPDSNYRAPDSHKICIFVCLQQCSIKCCDIKKLDCFNFSSQ